MSRTWLSIRVDLVEGHGERYWPRPGRIFAAARSHTFRQLADAIDDAFARWDRSHLQEFTLTGPTRLGRPDRDWEIEGEITKDYQRARLSRLRPGEQFVYVFDLGDDWAHLCTVGAQRIDPVEALGVLPGTPLPYWGWGNIPDQYRRRWDGDDGDSPRPNDPRLTDLPPLRASLGARQPTAGAQAHGTVAGHLPSSVSTSLHLQGWHPPRDTCAWSRGMITSRAACRSFPGRVSASQVGYRRQGRQAQDMETTGRVRDRGRALPGFRGARAAAVVAADARFREVDAERTENVAEVLPYRPGEFYLRELPPIRAVLSGLSGLSLLVVDGYADLDPGGRPGLGAYAHAEFGIPVIGVAKTAFRAASRAVPVLRGSSVRRCSSRRPGCPAAKLRTWCGTWPDSTGCPTRYAAPTHSHARARPPNSLTGSTADQARIAG